MAITIYDGYLELHALRAPTGNYLPELQENSELYDAIVSEEICMFEQDNAVELFMLGRSGRHVCIEDTPQNRRRYARLQRKAREAAEAMWRSMRDDGDGPQSEITQEILANVADRERHELGCIACKGTGIIHA